MSASIDPHPIRCWCNCEKKHSLSTFHDRLLEAVTTDGDRILIHYDCQTKEIQAALTGLLKERGIRH